MLHPDGDWRLRRADVQLQDRAADASGGVCAPANLRAAKENPAYAALMDQWIAARFTLRYTGGMVPDVHHILAKVRQRPCGLPARCQLWTVS